jgi:hypothetical protein
MTGKDVEGRGRGLILGIMLTFPFLAYANAVVTGIESVCRNKTGKEQSVPSTHSLHMRSLYLCNQNAPNCSKKI